MDDEFNILAYNELPISILFTPQQNIYEMVEALAVRARTLAAATRRNAFGVIHEIDGKEAKQAARHA